MKNTILNEFKGNLSNPNNLWTYTLISIMVSLFLLSFLNERVDIIYSMGGDYGLLPLPSQILSTISYYLFKDLLFLFPYLLIVTIIVFVIPIKLFPKKFQQIINSINFQLFEKLLLFVVLILSFLSLIRISDKYLERIIHVPDEYGYLFTAKTLAQSKFYLDPPEHPEFYEKQIIFEDRWISQYTPGHPLLLVPGILLKNEWLMPPFLATLSALFTFVSAKLLFGKKVAWLALILLITSPFYQMNSVNYMSHNSALFIGNLTFLFTALYLKWKNPYLLFFVSFSVIYMIMIRMYTGVFFALPIGLIILGKLRFRNRKTLSKELIYLVLGSILPLAFFGLFNYYNTGSIFKTNMTLGSFSVFGINEFRPPANALMDFLTNVYLLRETLFTFEKSIAFIGILLFVITFKNKVAFWLTGLPVLSLIVAYFFYKGSWMMYGPRFWYETMSLLAIITAVGLTQINYLIETLVNLTNSQKQLIRFSTIFIVFTSTLIGYYQWHTKVEPNDWYQSFTPSNANELKSFNYANTNLLNTVTETNLKNAVVFIKPGVHWWNYMVPSSKMYLDGEDNIIYVKDLGETENKKIINKYKEAGKKFYRADYDTATIEEYPEGYTYE